jgi:hypothetical protein
MYFLCYVSEIANKMLIKMAFKSWLCGKEIGAKVKGLDGQSFRFGAWIPKKIH